MALLHIFKLWTYSVEVLLIREIVTKYCAHPLFFFHFLEKMLFEARVLLPGVVHELCYPLLSCTKQITFPLSYLYTHIHYINI